MNFSLFKHSKFKNLSYYLVASVVSTIISLAINPFLSLGLSHEDFAIIGYFASFSLMLIPITSFSLNSYYARNYFLVNAEQRGKMLQSLLSLFLVFGLLMFLGFFCIYYFYHTKYITSIPFSPYALLSFLPVYFASFYNLYLLDLRMQDKAKRYATVTIINSLFGAILSLILVFFLKYGAEGRLISLLLVSIVFGIYSLRVEKFRFILEKKIVKEALYFCYPLSISAVLTFFFMGIDRTFLVRLNDNHSLGLYNVGLQISSYVGIFGTVFLQTFEPEIYKQISFKQHKKVFQLIAIIIIVTLIPNLVFMSLSYWLINILTFGKYVGATAYANILCLKNVTTSFSFSLSTVVVGYGFSKFELFNKALGAVLAIVLYYFLIKNYGFYGAAWGQSLSWLIMGVISIVFLLLIKRKGIKEIQAEP
jgi:O-antigen/teichoic acid export membrane protein